jgi:serine/threonine-protein kinase HipA
MNLSRQIGIEVPEIMLVPMKEIEGLPAQFEALQGKALAVKRFDRAEDGSRIHIEDFAQVFGQYPEQKYEQRNYGNIAQVLTTECTLTDVEEFVRRLAFSVLTGNGDMHLKNWSLIYRDGRTPALSPAYDLISTLPYIENDNLALTFGKSRSLDGIAKRQVERLAQRVGASSERLWQIVRDTAERTVECWRQDDKSELLSGKLREVIDQQIERVVRSTK